MDDAELMVKKEMELRARILGIYKKKREDFDTAAAYDDYLEMVEDIIWKLANDVDVLEVEEQVRGYAAEEAERARQRDLREQLTKGGGGGAGGAGGGTAFRGGYAPGAAAAGTAAATGSSLPVPLAAVPLEADGRIAVPEARRRPTQAQHAAAARAAGWSEAIPRLRALQDALRSVFAF